MNCETAEECLLDYLEGQLDEQQTGAMRAHVDACVQCRRALRETRELIDAIEHARRRQEQAWKQTSRAEASSASSAERSRSFTFEPGHQLGDFEILGEIGRGGMGVVYRARQITLNRVVALKVLPASVCQTESAVHRFVREAQAAAKLHHTNIVPVYAQGESDGHFYYAMELIDGPNLGWLMKDERSAILSGLDAIALSSTGASTDSSGISRMEGSGPRRRADFRRIAGLMASVADALEHAHRMNVIHRDIKPQNLLFGKDGEFHITDFGLARLLDEPNMTVTGEMLGTPAYMSPEQVDADRERIDARTDIYSLGVTLYELLTGRRPFEGTSREQVIARVRDREPVAPRKHDSNIPVDLDTICLRAMEKSPNRRYQTAEALAADLRRFAEDKPIHARRVGVVEKGIKWVRRHPAKFTIGMLVLVMMGGGIAWYAQVQADRTRLADRLVQQAFDHLAYENYRDGGQAREMLTAAAPYYSDQVLYWKTAGLSHVIEKPEEAEKYFLQVLERRPDDVECMYLLAWTLRRLKRPEECDAWVEKADKRLRTGGTEWAKRPTVQFFRATAIVMSRPEDAEESYVQAQTFRKSETAGESYYQALLHLGRAKNNAQYHTRSTEDFAAIERNLGMASTLHEDDAYPHYLFSLAYRINAEIYLSKGDLQTARRRFAKSLIHAEEAVLAEPNSPRGYGARSEFWESVGDRSAELGVFSSDAEKSRFHAEHAKLVEALQQDPATQGACRFCDWLGLGPSDALSRARDERSNGLQRCFVENDRVEFLEYRWLDNYWLGDFESASRDIRDLDRLVPATDTKKIWYTSLIPALCAAERDAVQTALSRLADDRGAALRSGDFRTVTSHACMLYVLGDGAAARAFLEASADAGVDFGEGLNASAPEGWWRRAWDVLALPGVEIDPESPSFEGVSKELRAPVYFFRAVVALEAGDRERAKRWLIACEECFDYEEYGYLARMLRRRMDADSDWPAWIRLQPATAN